MPAGRKMQPARRAAMEARESRYHGAPCAKGHDGQRYTSTGACVTCQAVSKAKWHGREYRAAVVAVDYEESLG